MVAEVSNLLLAPYFPVIANLVFGVFVTATCLKRGNWLLGTCIFATFFFAYTILPLVSQSTEARHYWFQYPRPVGLSIVATAFFSGMLLAAIASAPIGTTRAFLIRLPKLPFLALGFFAVSIPLAYWQHVVDSAGGGL